jgi:hypothetical protein
MMQLQQQIQAHKPKLYDEDDIEINQNLQNNVNENDINNLEKVISEKNLSVVNNNENFNTVISDSGMINEKESSEKDIDQ